MRVDRDVIAFDLAAIAQIGIVTAFPIWSFIVILLSVLVIQPDRSLGEARLGRKAPLAARRLREGIELVVRELDLERTEVFAQVLDRESARDRQDHRRAAK